MNRLQKIALSAALLALLMPLSATAQRKTADPGVLTFQDPITLTSLDEISLHDRLKDPKAGQRNIDFGAQFRMRYNRERNHRNTSTVANSRGLTGADDDFLLYRTRLWMDATLNRRGHFYFEFLDAESTLEEHAPRGNEVDRFDIHQAYLDLTVNDKLQMRVGRWSLDIGSTRMVGMGEWGNTRRAFDGLQATLAGEQFDFDAYYLQPLTMRPYEFNRTNHDVSIYGINSRQHVDDETTLQYYWLAMDTVGARFDTLGVYWKGERGNLLYELEGAVQVDTNFDDTDHKAGFGTVGLGTDLQGSLAGQLWVYFDWASGSNSTGNGFHHYQPRAHRFLGNMDLFGRRNINDLNVRWTHDPTDRLRFIVWYHYLSLVNINDVPYNTNMTPFAGLGPGTSGDSSLGHEIDLLVRISPTERLSFLIAYSHFFAGDYYRTTPGVPTSADADFFYTQMILEF